MFQGAEETLFFADEDAVIELSQNADTAQPSQNTSAVKFILFASLIPISSALVWIAIPTHQTDYLYYFVKLPIVVFLASFNCYFIACDLAGSFNSSAKKWITTSLSSLLTTVISVAITIGLASGAGQLEKLWMVPISFLMAYLLVSILLMVCCYLQPAMKHRTTIKLHCQVFLVMLVVHLQLVFSLVFGWVFTMRQEWFYQPILCALYPFGIMAFKVPLMLIAGNHINLQITCQVMSLAYAALPYRFLFPTLSTRWYVACLVLGVEICYKWLLFGLDLKRKVMSSPKLLAIQQVLCGNCQPAFETSEEAAIKKDRTRLIYVLFTYQTFLDSSFAVFIMVLFSFINHYKEASKQTGIPDLATSKFRLAYLFYPVGLLVSLLTFFSIVVYHQHSYKNDSQLDLTWKHMWQDDSKLIKKFAIQIALSCTTLYIILLWSVWAQTDCNL